MKKTIENQATGMKQKVRCSDILTGIEKRTILTLIDRWYHPAEWVLMSEGYFVCSRCHQEPVLKSYADLRSFQYCPTCGAMMKQPDWYRPEKEKNYD